MTRPINYGKAPKEFNTLRPQSVTSAAFSGERQKQGESNFTGGAGMGYSPLYFTGFTGYNNIFRNPVRRFYDPEITTTAIYLPRNIKQINRWNRWFYNHDEFIGAVLDLHAELPYSRAEIIVDDPAIKRVVEDCFDKTNFFSKLPGLDLEFMRIGEIFIQDIWSDELGYWIDIVPHNPDYIEVKFSPFADQEAIVELKPDEQLRSLIHSTKPEDQQLKKRLPKSIVKRVLTGKNIVLDSDEITHIARRSNPYDIRGTSILNRMHRVLMYEDKLREAQITIADNFIYPLKLFKLGDPQRGWIPDESHQQELGRMLQEANFDPNFSLIYHYGLSVEYITVADKVMRLDKEWTAISEQKMIALGVSKQFLSSEASYASANVGLQIQLSRYKAKRDLFESRWIRDKFFRVMAERNGWYKRDAREIVGQYRVKRSEKELSERLVIPELMWHKKLMLRDDQAFLTFLNNVYAQGKGPISAITMLMAMGLDLEDELKGKRKQKELEDRIGALIHPMAGAAGAPGMPPGMGGGTPGAGAPMPPPTLASRLMDRFKGGFNKKPKKEALIDVPKPLIDLERKDFIASGDIEVRIATQEKVLEEEKESIHRISEGMVPIEDSVWKKNLKSPNIPQEVVLLLNTYNNKLGAIKLKEENYVEGVSKEINSILKSLVEIYMQGKLTSYHWASFLPIYKEYYSDNGSLKDFSDIVLSNEFEDWIHHACASENDADFLHGKLRDLGNTCFCYGQLKGFQEQGVYNVKVSNVLLYDGFRYRISELLEKDRNLGSIISPKGEIVIFVPCIEGFDLEELDNNIDPHIKRTKEFSVNSIRVKDCPIEFYPFVERYLQKFSKYLKTTYNTIVFTRDIAESSVWKEAQKELAEKKYKDVDAKLKPALIAGEFMQESTKKIGAIPTFGYDKTLYISNWIGMEDCQITDNLIKYIDLGDVLEKAIHKSFKYADFNLTNDELSTYKIFGYIKPIFENVDTLVGWEMNSDILKYGDSVDRKLITGKVWDATGRCLGSSTKDPIQLFNENLKLWLDYPHKLEDDIKTAFNQL